MEKKIFIIEDDPNILYGLQDRFSSEGYEIETSNGDEDLDDLSKSVKKFHPDYLILDLILPKLDGFEIIKPVRRLFQPPPLLIGWTSGTDHGVCKSQFKGRLLRQGCAFL